MNKSGIFRVIAKRMRLRSTLSELRWICHWWSPPTSNQLYPSNIKDLVPNYVLVNGNDSTERGVYREII